MTMKEILANLTGSSPERKFALGDLVTFKASRLGRLYRIVTICEGSGFEWMGDRTVYAVRQVRNGEDYGPGYNVDEHKLAPAK